MKAKSDDGWKCIHFPAGLRYKGQRPTSMDRKDRKNINSKLTFVDVLPPFEDSLYDLYHPKDIIKRNRSSQTVFLYYIGWHLAKSTMEAEDEGILMTSSVVLHCRPQRWGHGQSEADNVSKKKQLGSNC